MGNGGRQLGSVMSSGIAACYCQHDPVVWSSCGGYDLASFGYLIITPCIHKAVCPSVISTKNASYVDLGAFMTPKLANLSELRKNSVHRVCAIHM